jgi:cell division septation protein DedD
MAPAKTRTPTVNSRYLEDEDLDTDSSDREISLSPSTLLGMFFLLAIICAVFFGFGYSMGHRSATTAVQSAENGDTAPLKASGDAKPAPGFSNSSSSLTPADAAAAQPVDESSNNDAGPADTPAAAPQPRLERASAPQPTPQLRSAVAVRAPAHAAATAPVVPRSAAGSPAALVQVAAVSHQEDADILASALKRKGYTVAIRHEPNDKLLHIQLGPFANRKEAEAMKQRLSSDGYNAIVK